MNPPSPVGPSSASSPRLLVLEVTPSATSKVLRTVDLELGFQHSIALCHDWATTPVPVGAIVRVILSGPSGLYLPWARRNTAHPVFVTRDANLLVLHPDTLVSGTAVADSFLCLRKAVLVARVPPANILRSAGGEAALFGSMIHALFQNLLVAVFGARPPAAPPRQLDLMLVYEAIEDLLLENVDDLYASSVSDTDARLVLHKVIPAIMAWFEAFVCNDQAMSGSSGVEVTGGKQRHKLLIEDVNDIEELVWSPIFGLKGKIDATVMLRIDGMERNVGVLELKTGSSVGYAAVSHSAQVNLYNLLMSDRYDRHITLGLLSYIRYQEALRMVKREQSGSEKGDRISLIETKGNFAQQPDNKSVSWVRGEMMGLVMQRNQFASYAQLDSPCTKLPPLLKGREDLCEKCFANDSCMIQHKLLENGTIETVEGGPGADLFRDKASHLTAAHSSYYRFWRKVLADEEAHAGKSRSEVWTMRGLQREALGRCLSNLMLVTDELDHETERCDLLSPGQRVSATFKRHDSQLDLCSPKDSALSLGDFVLISAESDGLSVDRRQFSSFTWQSALTNGFVESLSSTSVTVAVDRSLFAWATHRGIDARTVSWRIDSEEIFASHNTSKRTLENLFCNDDAAGLRRLRSLVVDGTSPSLDDQRLEISFIDEIRRKFSLTLNDDQNRALNMAMRAKDYLLILGMPGTGKTTTLASIVLTYACQGKSVLLCSHTNSAVDNLLQKFLDVGFTDFIRLGRNRRVIDSRIHPYHISTLRERERIAITEHLERALDKPTIVATTCLGINHPALIRRGRFDLVVVDEASQVLQPICLGPLQFAGGPFILVGDHYQLPPLLRAQQVRKVSMVHSDNKEGVGVLEQEAETSANESLFRRLCEFHPEAMISLSKQYRMASQIMGLSNELVYSGSLSCGTNEVAEQRLETSQDSSRPSESWLKPVLEPSRRVIFLDLPDGMCESESNAEISDVRRKDKDARRGNQQEVDVVLRCIKNLVEGGVQPQDITVLSPFRAQVGLIRGQLQPLGSDEGDLGEIGVFTIDQYQGRDNKCVIVSFVRNGGSVGPLLRDWRRINVALTRAKQKLILVGSCKTLRKGGFFWGGIVDYLAKQNCVVPVTQA